MSVICTKCGSIRVSCEAMVNPNDKSFIDFTDESFEHGWCNDCHEKTALTDVDGVKAEMEKNYRQFVERYGHEPHFVTCWIVWKDDNNNPIWEKISLSLDVDEEKDEEILFYTNGLEELKSLAEFGKEDFIIIGDIRFLGE